MNPTISLQTMGKVYGKMGSFTLVMQPLKTKEYTEWKLVILSLKSDLVSYPARGGWVG